MVEPITFSSKPPNIEAILRLTPNTFVRQALHTAIASRNVSHRPPNIGIRKSSSFLFICRGPSRQLPCIINRIPIKVFHRLTLKCPQLSCMVYQKRLGSRKIFLSNLAMTLMGFWEASCITSASSCTKYKKPASPTS